MKEPADNKCEGGWKCKCFCKVPFCTHMQEFSHPTHCKKEPADNKPEWRNELGETLDAWREFHNKEKDKKGKIYVELATGWWYMSVRHLLAAARKARDQEIIAALEKIEEHLFGDVISDKEFRFPETYIKKNEAIDLIKRLP